MQMFYGICYCFFHRLSIGDSIGIAIGVIITIGVVALAAWMKMHWDDEDVQQMLPFLAAILRFAHWLINRRRADRPRRRPPTPPLRIRTPQRRAPLPPSSHSLSSRPRAPLPPSAASPPSSFAPLPPSSASTFLTANNTTTNNTTNSSYLTANINNSTQNSFVTANNSTQDSHTSFNTPISSQSPTYLSPLSHASTAQHSSSQLQHLTNALTSAFTTAISNALSSSTHHLDLPSSTPNIDANPPPSAPLFSSIRPPRHDSPAPPSPPPSSPPDRRNRALGLAFPVNDEALHRHLEGLVAMQEAYNRAARPASVRRIHFADREGDNDERANKEAGEQTDDLARPLDKEQTDETVGADGFRPQTNDNANESGYTSNIGQ